MGLLYIYNFTFNNNDLSMGGIYYKGFPCGSDGKESACNAEDLGSIPGLGRSPGEGKGYPLQYSGLENCMDHIVHGVVKSQTQLSNFHLTSHITNLSVVRISKDSAQGTPLEVQWLRLHLPVWGCRFNPWSGS